MPHLKVKPFDSRKISLLLGQSSIISFYAKSLFGPDEVLGIRYNKEEFLLQIKPGKRATLIKYDKVTRPLDANLIKETLAIVAKELGVEILSSNIAISKTKNISSFEYLKKIEDFEEIDFPKKRVCIEIGFGSGRHLVYQAVKNPDTLFIGLEIHTPSAQQLLKQIKLQGLENIWVVNYDARLFLEMLPSNICHKIFVHFPVPWDKKPHRRVISHSFLTESMRVLNPDGRLEVRTDSNRYFWYTLEIFFGLPKAKVEICKNKDLEVTSKYEARWRRLKKDIYDIYITSKENSEEKNSIPDFNFNIVKYRKDLENRIPKESLVFDGYFVHFEQIYKTDDAQLLIKCAFGSFDRPEHKYIILSRESCRYFASSPVRTKINFQAHQKIMEILNV